MPRSKPGKLIIWVYMGQGAWRRKVESDWRFMCHCTSLVRQPIFAIMCELHFLWSIDSPVCLLHPPSHLRILLSERPASFLFEVGEGYWGAAFAFLRVAIPSPCQMMRRVWCKVHSTLDGSTQICGQFSWCCLHPVWTFAWATAGCICFRLPLRIHCWLGLNHGGPLLRAWIRSQDCRLRRKCPGYLWNLKKQMLWFFLGFVSRIKWVEWRVSGEQPKIKRKQFHQKQAVN